MLYIRYINYSFVAYFETWCFLIKFNKIRLFKILKKLATVVIFSQKTHNVILNANYIHSNKNQVFEIFKTIGLVSMRIPLNFKDLNFLKHFEFIWEIISLAFSSFQEKKRNSIRNSRYFIPKFERYHFQIYF